jgi:hypothetical protein
MSPGRVQTLGAPSRIRSAASWLQLVADETTLQSNRMHKPLIDAGGQTSGRHSGPFHGCQLTCACFNAICCCHVVLSASRIDAVCADSTSLSCWYLPKQPHSSVPQRCTVRSTCWCVQVYTIGNPRVAHRFCALARLVRSFSSVRRSRSAASRWLNETCSPPYRITVRAVCSRELRPNAMREQGQAGPGRARLG